MWVNQRSDFLKAIWPLVDPHPTPHWPLTLSLHYTSAIGHSKATDLWMTFDLGRVASKICSQPSLAHPLPHAKFQLDTSKHDEMHSRIYTPIYIHIDLAILVGGGGWPPEPFWDKIYKLVEIFAVASLWWENVISFIGFGYLTPWTRVLNFYML